MFYFCSCNEIFVFFTVSFVPGQKVSILIEARAELGNISSCVINIVMTTPLDNVVIVTSASTSEIRRNEKEIIE